MLLVLYAPFLAAAGPVTVWDGLVVQATRDGEWWRLITAVFLHGGLLHISANMFALAVIGPVTERRICDGVLLA